MAYCCGAGRLRYKGSRTRLIPGRGLGLGGVDWTCEPGWGCLGEGRRHAVFLSLCTFRPSCPFVFFLSYFQGFFFVYHSASPHSPTSSLRSKVLPQPIPLKIPRGIGWGIGQPRMARPDSSPALTYVILPHQSTSVRGTNSEGKPANTCLHPLISGISGSPDRIHRGSPRGF